MEIIKKLYDIGTLFEMISDIELVACTFEKIASVELGYRKIKDSGLIVIDEIIRTAMCISTRGSGGSGDFPALQNGIKQMSRFIYSEHFHIERAVVFASRAAYCAMLIKTKAEHFIRFVSPAQISDLIIEQPFETRLNKLKKTNPEAFFYCYQVFLLSENIKQTAGKE